MKKDNPLLRALAQKDFWAFCLWMDYEFFMIKRPFLYDVAQAMQQVVNEYRDGRAIKISVSMPPRAGKSYITSLFACYWLTQFPELSVMRNCCTSTLYDKFSYDTRALVRSDRFREAFPHLQLSADKQNVSGWNITTAKQVSYFGSGVGGTIIGFGANLAITDDLYKSMQDALSTTVQQTTKSWKQSAHDSRKERNCPEVYIGTRWTRSDIIGEAMESGELHTSVVIPALDVDDCSFCEDVKTTDEYLDIRSKIEPYIWSAEYMQEPYEVEGLLLPADSLRFEDISQIPPSAITYRCAFVDPADTGGDKFSAILLDISANSSGITCYVRDVIHNTVGVMQNIPDLVNRLTARAIDDVFVEQNGVGVAAVIQLKSLIKGVTKVVPFPSTEPKEVRIMSNYEFVKMTFVFDSSYKTRHEYLSFIRDLTGYIKGGDNKHKADAIDVCTTASKILKIKFRTSVY